MFLFNDCLSKKRKICLFWFKVDENEIIWLIILVVMFFVRLNYIFVLVVILDFVKNCNEC